ncbi:hypothetical protein V498_00146 [Pseudogymnoascus sp. VKM F-4517 (FW-2822)]|nr:hypothetical protein V498_00146 [Pseudogymnoascus sp. VKM F-4517 (FW-2822)]
MEEHIAGHGSKPLMQKAQGEGIYASFMPTDLIVTRLDQGLTLPPKIHPETAADNGGSHKESTTKEHATKDSTSEVNDPHLKDDLSQENAGSNDVDCTNETQQEHTGKIYDPCQHIQPILQHQQEKPTDGRSSLSFLEQKQPGFYSSFQAPDHALEFVPEQRLAKIQLAGCQGSSDEEPANQFQLARINENIPSVFPMGGRAMPGSPRPPQDTAPQTQMPKVGDAGILYNRGCTTAIEQPVAPKHLTSKQTDDLRYRGIGDRGQELTLSLGSKIERLFASDMSQEVTLSLGSRVEKLAASKLSMGSMVERLSASESSLGSMAEMFSGSRLSQEITLSLGSMATRLPRSELSSATLKGVVNKGDRKEAGNVSAPEQLQDQKSQDEKVQYEEPQCKIHTSGQVPVSVVERETKAAGIVCCGVASPKAEGVEASLYSPIYKSPKANAASQVNTTISATIRNSPASKHTPTILQHRSLSAFYSSQPQLLALRDYIATAPLPFHGVRKIQQVILAAMDGEIELEGDPRLDALLEAIWGRMMVGEKFQNDVIAFVLSKLCRCYPLATLEPSLTMAAYTITDNDTSSSNQSSHLGANATAFKAPSPKFNIKSCTLEELKEEYNAIKALAKKERQLALDSISKRNSLQESVKELKKERDHWKAISSSIPSAKTMKDEIPKWMCTSCYLLNDFWADLTDWAPGKAPNGLKPGPEEAGIPESNKNTWSPTEYCRCCGLHKSGRRPEENSGSPRKRKLAGVTEKEKSTPKNGAGSKRRCKGMEAGLNTWRPVAPTTHSFQAEGVDLPVAAPGAQLPLQVPCANQDTANIQQGRSNSSSPFTQYLPEVNGTVADQQYSSMGNGTVSNRQFSSRGNGTVSNQQSSPSINGTVPSQQFSPMGNGTVSNQQFSQNTNGTIPGQQLSPNGNGTISNQQLSPNGNGTVSNQQFSPNSNGTIPGQQYSPSGNGTVPGQKSPTGRSGTITGQQPSPCLTGTGASQQHLPSTSNPTAGQLNLPSTNGTITNQQLAPDVMNMFTDQFAGDDDLFANFDFDALPEDPFPMTDWLSGTPSFNTGVVTGAAPQTPNALSPGQTALPSTSTIPSNVGLSKEAPIAIEDDDPIFAISQADMGIINSLTSSTSAPTTPAQPQSKVCNHTQPGVMYDMRGNQVSPSTLPTIRCRKAMAPRTARLGALTFPSSPDSAEPKDAAPGTTQHPNGG